MVGAVVRNIVRGITTWGHEVLLSQNVTVYMSYYRSYISSITLLSPILCVSVEFTHPAYFILLIRCQRGMKQLQKPTQLTRDTRQTS